MTGIAIGVSCFSSRLVEVRNPFQERVEHGLVSVLVEHKVVEGFAPMYK